MQMLSERSVEGDLMHGLSSLPWLHLGGSSFVGTPLDGLLWTNRARRSSETRLGLFSKRIVWREEDGIQTKMAKTVLKSWSRKQRMDRDIATVEWHNKIAKLTRSKRGLAGMERVDSEYLFSQGGPHLVAS
ncbi:hypothetical protein QJS10_CPB12g01201 [Acorus calamus]|uniref:Uncharacterized protein n=1 Tax=Acorus calamus TaxID=4465 RepID=A0AAV9DQU6_ACOCL|nr:hypothetical protein QJS10_CPB12g01201 [Acorus calamus]